MKRITLFILTLAAAALFAACGAPAENKPANTNTNANTAKPVAAAPTKEALFEMDKKANEAWVKGDKAYFETFLGDKFVSFERGERMSRAELLAMIGSFKCDVKNWSLEDPQMVKIDADTYVVSYKGNFDGSCSGPDGKAEKIPSPVRSASIYTRSGDKWVGAFHSETMIIDPKAPPPPPAKADAKKEEPKKDDKAATNSNAAPAPAKPAPSANTEALVRLHTAGWEAFKAKDAKWFEANLTADASVVDPLGSWISGRANVIKQWTETMKCEGITKVSVTDGFSTALSPTVELLTLKGTADGKCDGQPNGPLYQSAVYVKEGDAWKLAFIFESPAM